MITKSQQQSLLTYVKAYLTDIERQLKYYKEVSKVLYQQSDVNDPNTIEQFNSLNAVRNHIRKLQRLNRKFASIAKNLKH